VLALVGDPFGGVGDLSFGLFAGGGQLRGDGGQLHPRPGRLGLLALAGLCPLLGWFPVRRFRPAALLGGVFPFLPQLLGQRLPGEVSF
jgi:hypothetical protein